MVSASIAGCWLSSFETRRHAEVSVCTIEGPAPGLGLGATPTLLLLPLLLLVQDRLQPIDSATVLTCVGAGNGQDSTVTVHGEELCQVM